MAGLKTLDNRMLDLMEILKYQGEIRFNTEFCAVAGIYKQDLRNILHGPTSFTGKHIENVCKNYGVNANWIFDIEPNVFRGRKNTAALNKFITELRKVKRIPLVEPKVRQKKGEAKMSATPPSVQ